MHRAGSLRHAALSKWSTSSVSALACALTRAHLRVDNAQAMRSHYTASRLLQQHEFTCLLEHAGSTPGLVDSKPTSWISVVNSRLINGHYG